MPHSSHIHAHTQSSLPTDRKKAVPLLQFVFVCASVISYVKYVLTLYVPHLFFWRLGWAVLRAFGISYVFSIIIVYQIRMCAMHELRMP